MDTYNGKSYYDVLNVSSSASKLEIREAYIRLKNTYGGHNQALYSLISEDEAGKMLREVELAFDILNDDMKKINYDRGEGFEEESAPGRDVFHAEFGEQGVPSSEVAVRSRSTGEIFGASSNDRPAHSQPKAFHANSLKAEACDEALIKTMEGLIESSDTSEGALYRELRDLAGVSEQEMQERTKISLESIRAIETNTYGQLPKAVFVKGFLRSYFKYLSVPNSDTLVASFIGRLENWQTDQSLTAQK